MPIPREMFNILGDYSELENMHPYGDFLSLYSLPVHASIAEAADIFRDLRELDDRILTLYVSYILSKAGYYVSDFSFPIEGISGPVITTRLEDEAWLNIIGYFEHEEEGVDEEWSIRFENEKGEAIKIYFLTMFLTSEDPETKQYDETVPMRELLDSQNSLEESCPERRVDRSFFIIHPRIIRKTKEAFIRTKVRMKEVVGEDIVLSPGQFVSRFIPEDDRRRIVEANWDNLRDRMLAKFQSEWRILIFSLHDKQLSESRDQLRKARLKFESGTDYQGSVLDAGIACEGLLKILHSVFPKRIQEKMEFNDYLCDVKQIIVEDYGEDIYNDLDFIRIWRNNVVHAPIVVPSFSIALKVLTKTELFQNLFLENIKTRVSQQK